MKKTDSCPPLSWLGRVLSLLALLALACGGEPETERPALVRLIDQDPIGIFQRAALLDIEVVRTWDFKGRTDLAGWRLNHKDSEFTVGARGLRIQPEHRFTTLELLSRVDAATIDAFEVRVQGLPRHRVSLQWRSEGQGYAKRREVSAPLGRDEGNGWRVFRLPLGEHPDWQGPGNQIRIAFSVPKNGEVLIERVDAVEEKISDPRLVEALSRPWKVELGDDLRNSLLAPPGIAIDRALEIPQKGRLSFSIGLQEGAPSPTTFEIWIRDQDQRETLLFEEDLQTPGIWKEATVDLTEFAGRRTDLSLRTSTPKAKPTVSFPLWANPEAVGQPDRALNVLFISIDTLRADHLSIYGYTRPTTPAIDRWALERGIVFENVIAAAPWTLPAHVSMFTGLNAHRHGVNYPVGDLQHLTTLAQLLQETGYATLAITGGGFVHPQYGFARGFDRYQTRGVGMASDQELEQGLGDAIAALERYRDRPFFLFFHTYEVHNPFRARQPYLEELTGRTTPVTVDVARGEREARRGFVEVRTLKMNDNDGPEASSVKDDPYTLALDLYDSQIAHADQAVGQLLETLERLDLADKTLVILTSDHGELFGEHGLANHVSLYEDNLRVPLILSAPHRPWSDRHIAEQVRSVDIMPTLLDLLEIPGPADLDGVSLVPLIETGTQKARDAVAISYAAASNHGVSVRQDNRSKYHFRNQAWVSEEPAEMFFDLSEDPAEARPLESPDPDAERLRGSLQRQFAAESSGLRIRLSNLEGSEPLAGALQGSDLQVSRPKALDTVSAVLRRQSGSQALFEVAPGRVAELFLEGAMHPLVIQLTPPHSPGEEITLQIDPASLEAVAALHRTPTGFDKMVLLEPSGDGVLVWWQGRRPDATDELMPIDPELQQQLEALGYIDN